MERYADECDVCIVGGGPAGIFLMKWKILKRWPYIIWMTYVDLSGMSTAIKLKQLANEAGDEVIIDHLSQSDSCNSQMLSSCIKWCLCGVIWFDC